MKPNKWRKWIVGVALVLACVESAALWQLRGKYLRYVSAPLADGTRYTFLYPARLSIVKSESTSAWMESVPAVPPVSVYERSLKRGLVWLGWPQDVTRGQLHGSQISVYGFYTLSGGKSLQITSLNSNSCYAVQVCYRVCVLVLE